MNVIFIAVFSIGALSLLLGIMLEYAYRYSDNFSTILKYDFIDRIEELLPQIQCGQCGYPGCRPYAEAISSKNEKIDLCIPGGSNTIKKIAELLNETSFNSSYVINQPLHMSAIIDEINCIGCNKCVQVCPVDAIIGARHTVHTVITDLCTGCGLCIVPCPSQCIQLKKIENVINDNWTWSSETHLD